MPLTPRITKASERLIFSPTVEALLLRGVGDRMTPALEEGIRVLGIDIKKALLPAYPVDTWLKVLDLVGKTVLARTSEFKVPAPGSPPGLVAHLDGAAKSVTVTILDANKVEVLATADEQANGSHNLLI